MTLDNMRSNGVRTLAACCLGRAEALSAPAKFHRREHEKTAGVNRRPSFELSAFSHVAAIAVRITVSADPKTKTAKSATMEASVMMAGSGRLGWRNQANCRYCEQGDDHFTQHCFVLVQKISPSSIETLSEQDCSITLGNMRANGVRTLAAWCYSRSGSGRATRRNCPTLVPSHANNSFSHKTHLKGRASLEGPLVSITS